MRVTTSTTRPGPLKNANTVNSILEATEAFQLQKRLGKGGSREQHGPPTDVIKVRNDSGAARRLGEVLECDDNSALLGSIDPQHLWLKGVTPNGSRGFGILRHPTPASAIDQLQVSGACKALVNFSDASHRAAYVESGGYVLKSAYIGPVQVLYKPSGTGEKECVVRFFDSISVSEQVQVWVGTGSPTSGDLTAANADGLHSARVCRWVSGALATHEDCWLRLVDWEDVDDGDTIAVHGRIHHAKYTGATATSSSVTKPLYLGNIAQQGFVGKGPSGGIPKGNSDSILLYNGDETSSGISKTCKALGAAIPTGTKWVKVERISGAWYVGCWEL